MKPKTICPVCKRPVIREATRKDTKGNPIKMYWHKEAEISHLGFIAGHSIGHKFCEVYTDGTKAKY